MTVINKFNKLTREAHLKEILSKLTKVMLVCFLYRHWRWSLKILVHISKVYITISCTNNRIQPSGMLLINVVNVLVGNYLPFLQKCVCSSCRVLDSTMGSSPNWSQTCSVGFKSGLWAKQAIAWIPV